MNVANNEDFKKNLKKLCIISQIFLLQGKIYNLLTKSYHCVMENTTVNAINAAKTLCGNQMYRISLTGSPKFIISHIIHWFAVIKGLFQPNLWTLDLNGPFKFAANKSLAKYFI